MILLCLRFVIQISVLFWCLRATRDGRRVVEEEASRKETTPHLNKVYDDWENVEAFAGL